jgi:hypothetical protein
MPPGAKSLRALNQPTRRSTRSRFELLDRGTFEKTVRDLEHGWIALTGAARLERIEGSRHDMQ